MSETQTNAPQAAQATSRQQVTLTHPTAKPSTVTTSNPTHITQLKSQGYRVATAEEAAEAAAAVYADRKGPELRAEIDRRNATRDEESRVVPAGRRNEDLIAALQADDAAEAAAASGDADGIAGEGDGAGSGDGE